MCCSYRQIGTFLVVIFVSSSDIASLSLVDGKPVLDPPYASASDGNNSSSSRDENSNVQKAIPEYPVLKLLSGSNATKVHRKLLTGRSRRSYCISEPTSQCSTSCSCPSGSSKLSHSALSGGSCYTCSASSSSCSSGYSLCCNKKCVDSDYIRDGGTFGCAQTSKQCTRFLQPAKVWHFNPHPTHLSSVPFVSFLYSFLFQRQRLRGW